MTALASPPEPERSRWIAEDWHDHPKWRPGSVHPAEELPIEDYHAGPGVSKSRLDAAHLNVHHMLHREWPRARHLDFGSAVHDSILLPEVFASRYARSTQPNRVQRKKWAAELEAAEADGRVLLASGDYDQAARWGDVARRHPDAGPLLTGTLTHETTYVWEDEETGLLCRCRPDAGATDHAGVIDLKHKHAADRESFRRAVFANRYHVSAVMTAAGIRAVTGVTPGYAFVVLDKQGEPAPEYIAVYQVDDALRGLGWEELRGDLERVADFAFAERRGETPWTGYPLGIQTITYHRGGAA